MIEKFTHDGREYKFRVGMDRPRQEKMIIFRSSHYKEIENDFLWGVVLMALPFIIAAIILISYVNSDPKEGIVFLGNVSFFLIMMLYGSVSKFSAANSSIKDLKERAEKNELIAAYDAWVKERNT